MAAHSGKGSALCAWGGRSLATGIASQMKMVTWTGAGNVNLAEGTWASGKDLLPSSNNLGMWYWEFVSSQNYVGEKVFAGSTENSK